MPKRKLADTDQDPEQPASHGSTLFVSNLPYTATSTDLQTLFSDIAPVRSAFVVLEGTGDARVSKGVGYVSFALRSDAEDAFTQIHSSGLDLNGRKLRVQWAENKPKDRPEPSKSTPPSASKPRPAPYPKTKTPSDPFAIRTIVLSGLPSGLAPGVLWKKLRKYKGCEKVDWPLRAGEGGEEGDPRAATALFATPAAAADAVSKLHAHVYKGTILSVTLKKHLDTLVKHTASPKSPSKAKAAPKSEAGPDIPQEAQTTTSNAKPHGPAPNRASRLIARNLPYDVSEQDLRALFLPYGPIYSVHIPVGSLSNPTPNDSAPASNHAPPAPNLNLRSKDPTDAKKAPSERGKGFAFIWFLSRKDAQNALVGVNGRTVRAGLARKLMEDKQKRKKVRREEAKAKRADGGKEKGKKEDDGDESHEEGEGDDGSEDDDGEDEEGENSAEERVVAVDWALSKDKWEEAKARMTDPVDAEGDVQMPDAGPHSGSDSDSEDGDSDPMSGEEDSDVIGVHGEGSDSESSEDEDEDARTDEDEAPTRPTLPATDTGTTVFVRNIPFEATEDELRTLFRSFGPLRYARITMDQTTGRSRGTGFACFWNKEDADRAVEQSALLRAETGVESGPTTSAKVKKNPFTMPSVLTPDPSSSLAQSLVMHGRTLDVVRAVTRERAGQLKEAGERAREKADKRNLYLMREGVILANSSAASTLPPAELEKRSNAYNARRALLNSNPSLYVSKTRLSVRQIPMFVSERGLKRLALHATRAFEEEVARGERAPLTTDELADVSDEDGDDGDGGDEDVRRRTKSGANGNGNGKGKHGERATAVKQAKIVRASDRVDSVTGKGRSKGYGFLEMHTHADALRVLRWANNHPGLGALFEEWWLAELGDLLKGAGGSAGKGSDKGKGSAGVKGKDGAEETESEKRARWKRIKDEMERVKERVEKRKSGPGVGGDVRTLIMEFSIENVQVVRRRLDRERTTPGDASSTPRQKIAFSAKKEEDEDARSSKKRKLDKKGPRSAASKPDSVKGTKPVAEDANKSGSRIGGIIGKKRKERRMKKAG